MTYTLFVVSPCALIRPHHQKRMTIQQKEDNDVVVVFTRTKIKNKIDDKQHYVDCLSSLFTLLQKHTRRG
jgi:hypothetical protein